MGLELLRMLVETRRSFVAGVDAVVLCLNPSLQLRILTAQVNVRFLGLIDREFANVHSTPHAGTAEYNFFGHFNSGTFDGHHFWLKITQERIARNCHYTLLVKIEDPGEYYCLAKILCVGDEICIEYFKLITRDEQTSDPLHMQEEQTESDPHAPELVFPDERLTHTFEILRALLTSSLELERSVE